MFRGRRDPEVGIIVPIEKCSPYASKNGGTWVEVSVPPEDAGGYAGRWGTMMVEKKQVDVVSVCGIEYNYIRVNDMADIVVSVKDSNHKVIDGETLKPVLIIGRYLKYYRWAEFEGRIPDDKLNEATSLDMYNDFSVTGYTMAGYMNRLPKTLPVAYTMSELEPEDPLAGLSLSGGGENE